MRDRGFSAIELTVTLTLMAIILVFCLPSFVRANVNEREEEVKANIHTIQIALERYAVDSGGYYPLFMIGAERDSNIIMNFSNMRDNYTATWPTYGMTPFCKVTGYNGATGITRIRQMVDPLIQWGYLSEFPVNPFARPDNGLWNSSSDGNTGATGVYPYGGFHGDKMFDLGFGWGDTPQTDFILYTTESIDESAGDSDPDLDAPGNLYYHPIFEDLAPVYVHYAANYGAVHLGMGNVVRNNDVVGYYLYGYGAPAHRDSFEKLGMDYFNRMPASHWMPQGSLGEYQINIGINLNSTAGAANQARVEATGYPAAEYDPWTGASPMGTNQMRTEPEKNPLISGPDGINDWVIIEVTSGFEFDSNIEVLEISE